MKKFLILGACLAGFVFTGCGESEETRANIDRRKEARRRQAIKDAREIHRIQRENIRKHSTPAPETLFFNENPAGKDKE